MENKKGLVQIVGAGIGPADFITLAAQKALEKADVIVYDRLLNPKLWSAYEGKKELFYAGKAAADHHMTQDEINRLLVEKGLEGKRVVRLKGGDPYVFGRGGEEALACREAGLAFEVIPGVTSGIVSLMYCGVPATHRGYSESVSFITGNRKAGQETNYADYAKLNGTLVFYMGLNNLSKITRDLLAGGMDPQRPAGVIYHGGYSDQKIHIASLESLAEEMAELDFGSPSLIVVGDVLKLREALNFYEEKPLFGCRVMVPRATAQAGSLCQMLEETGADVVEVPCLAIHQTLDEATKEKIANFKDHGYSHLLFHSPNAMELFFQELLAVMDVRALGDVRIGCVGAVTAKYLSKYGLKADLVPDRFQGEDLIALVAKDQPKKIFLPHSAGTRPELLKSYETLAELDAPVIYETRLPEKKQAYQGADYLLFTSASAVENFVSLYGLEALKAGKAIAIGEITARAIESQGGHVYGQAEKATMESMVEFILQDRRKEQA